jgi:hypothetical protein
VGGVEVGGCAMILEEGLFCGGGVAVWTWARGQGGGFGLGGACMLC